MSFDFTEDPSSSKVESDDDFYTSYQPTRSEKGNARKIREKSKPQNEPKLKRFPTFDFLLMILDLRLSL